MYIAHRTLEVHNWFCIFYLGIIINCMKFIFSINIDWIVTIANLPNFLLMYDLLEKSQKSIVAKHTLDAFLRSFETKIRLGTSVHNLLLRMCCILADGLDALSIIGEKIYRDAT